MSCFLAIGWWLAIGYSTVAAIAMFALWLESRLTPNRRFNAWSVATGVLWLPCGVTALVLLTVDAVRARCRSGGP